MCGLQVAGKDGCEQTPLGDPSLESCPTRNGYETALEAASRTTACGLRVYDPVYLRYPEVLSKSETVERTDGKQVSQSGNQSGLRPSKASESGICRVVLVGHLTTSSEKNGRRIRFAPAVFLACARSRTGRGCHYSSPASPGLARCQKLLRVAEACADGHAA